MAVKQESGLEVAQSGEITTYRTLNNMGFVFNLKDEYTTAFIEYAGTATGGPIADVGCASGIMTKRILAAGAKSVIANDLHEGHLTLLNESLNQDEKSRIKLIPGSVLDIDRVIPPASLAGVLAANLVLFFQPKELRQLFALFYKLLQKNGKLCVVTSNTHNKWFKEWPKVTKHGDEWPGLIGVQAEELGADEFLLNLMDPSILEREAKLAGFLVEKAGFIDLGVVFEPFGSEDGVGSGSGLIAIKP